MSLVAKPRPPSPRATVRSVSCSRVFLPLLPATTGGTGALRGHSFGIGSVFLAVALLRPNVLSPLNRLWIKLGVLMAIIMSPIVLGLLFFLVVTPVGLLMRATGKDPLRLRQDPRVGSYWIVRHPPGPPGESMGDQF